MCIMKLLNGIWICFIFVQSFAQSGFCAVGIRGSAHDFTGKIWAKDEICQACHAPHHSDATQVAAPLWNHTSTQQFFTPYTSATLKANVGQPDGVSKLCLSCHDGTVALDSFGGFSGDLDASGNLANKIGNQIGPDLNSNQGHSLVHPISFVYDSSLAGADNTLNDPTQVQTVIVNAGLKGGGTIRGSLLVNDKLQCTSCHDSHNEQGNEKLLKLPLENNALCTACHKGM